MKEKTFDKIKVALKNAIFPEDITCDVCGNELVGDMRYRLCSTCAEKLPLIKGHICLNCGVPILDESDYCLRCQNNESVFRLCRAPLEYDGIATQLIYTMKFGKKKYIAHTLGAMMADTFISNNMQGEIIVPVPMTEEEENNRGFNQAELLAYDVGKRLGLPVLPALAKIKDTSQQKQLGGKERAKNLEDAFEVVYPQIKDRKILLIDDVFTTGATANECARTLLKSKARQVDVLTAAVTKQKLLLE